MLRQISAILLSLLSGIILALPFANGTLWIFSWFGFLPLLLALQGKPGPQAFLLAWCTGFAFWLSTGYWLIHVSMPGMLCAVSYLALYFGLFGFTCGVWGVSGFRSLWLLSSVWVILEYIRTHLLTGLGWALLGYSQYLNLPVIQIADITGVWGVSFLVMMVNLACLSLCAGRSRIARAQALITALVMLAVIAYGGYRLYKAGNPRSLAPLTVSVIQGNIPQELKWDVKSREEIVGQYLRLSAGAAALKPDLLIWPEAALPVVLEEEPLFFASVRDFVRASGVPLLLGAVTRRQQSYYNSAILVPAGSGTMIRYDKLHLVPFGEYIPLRRFLRFLETVVPIGDFTPGTAYTIFPLPSSARNINPGFSVLICFEDTFPELARRFVNAGAGFLVNITNDAWFKDTPAPYQHLQASVFRAVENRVYVARAANTGVSGFIAPSGAILSLVRNSAGKCTYVEGSVSYTIDASRPPATAYTLVGDVFVGACFLFFVTHMAARFKKRA
jgi:apolipoprotein N-acyltransferase